MERVGRRPQPYNTPCISLVRSCRSAFGSVMVILVDRMTQHNVNLIHCSILLQQCAIAHGESVNKQTIRQ